MLSETRVDAGWRMEEVRQKGGKTCGLSYEPASVGGLELGNFAVAVEFEDVGKRPLGEIDAVMVNSETAFFLPLQQFYGLHLTEIVEHGLKFFEPVGGPTLARVAGKELGISFALRCRLQEVAEQIGDLRLLVFDGFGRWRRRQFRHVQTGNAVDDFLRPRVQRVEIGK